MTRTKNEKNKIQSPYLIAWPYQHWAMHSKDLVVVVVVVVFAVVVVVVFAVVGTTSFAAPVDIWKIFSMQLIMIGLNEKRIQVCNEACSGWINSN